MSSISLFRAPFGRQPLPLASSFQVCGKSDKLLGTNLRYGNFINAPLYGDLVPKGKTVFVNPETLDPYPNQWSVLRSVIRHKESDLDRLIELNRISSDPPPAIQGPAFEGGGQGFRGLPPCAVKMLQNGVTQFQRVSCFRLAVHIQANGAAI